MGVLKRGDERLRDRRAAALGDRAPLAKADHAVVRGDDLTYLGVVEAGDALHAVTLRKGSARTG
jgi:hypothetical protein